jgi:hypothetical protein
LETEEVAIVTGIDPVGAIVRVKELVAVCFVGDVESVAFAVKLNEPDAVGVPEITPEEAASDNPGGRLPELKLQEYGAVPPEAASNAW